MSVGKMNQLYANDRFLTPEKRCSKGPSMYRYPNPRTYKILNKSYETSTLFPLNNPSYPDPLPPRATNTYTYNLIYPKPTQIIFTAPDLTPSIDSALSLIKSSKIERHNKNIKRQSEIQSSISRYLTSIKKDILTISEVSQEMESLKGLLMNYS